MAAYCDIDQLSARYGAPMLLQLSDRGGAFPTEPDTALFARAIADAGALIDGYLGGRYQLPLVTVPELVTNLAQVVAIYMAHGSVAPEKIRKDYDDALRQLQAIANGTMVISAAGIEAAGTEANEVLTNEPSRPLTADTMTGYI